MLKFFLICINVFVCIYWLGDLARQNAKIDDFVAHLEVGYGVFNQRLRDAKLHNGLVTLRRVYGWAAILTTALVLAFGRTHTPPSRLGTVWMGILFTSTLGWYSIKWCTEHRKTVREVAPQTALIVLCPILMGVLDILAGTSFTVPLFNAFAALPVPRGWHIPIVTNPMVIGLCASAVLGFFVGVYYAITWIFTAPAACLSVLVITVPVMLARFIHLIAPRKAFVGLTILVFIATSFGLAYL